MQQKLTQRRKAIAAAAAKSLQSCPTLCDPIDGSPPGSPVPGILQARTLEWVVISFSNAWKWKVKVKSLSCVRIFTTPWTAAHRAPLSMGFSRREYWSGVPSPSPIWLLYPLLKNFIHLFGGMGSYLCHARPFFATLWMWCMGSAVAAQGLSCFEACGIPVSQAGIELTSHALQGRFLTTGPPGKASLPTFFFLCQYKVKLYSWWCGQVSWVR